MKTPSIHILTAKLLFASLLLPTLLLANETPPALTKNPEIDRSGTYNLGPTGLRGWIHTKPKTHHDGIQGRTTSSARQILVTHVGKNSPADGILEVNDVILGVNQKPFSDDARQSFARAIQEAEKETNQGKLSLTRWRDGQTEEATLNLKVLGSYSETAPYNCPKSQRILEAACAALEKENLRPDWTGSISGLALLSTGDPKYLPKIQEFAHQIAEKNQNLDPQAKQSTWNLGYQALFLTEYFLLTQDPKVKASIHELALTLAHGQSMYGTYGHGFAELKPDGSKNGSIPPYGPVNMAGLPANLALILSKKCGVQHPDLDQAINRAIGFFGYYAGKGAIPYGEHEPWPYHENNGKNSLTAILFATLGNHPEKTQFFAQTAVAGYVNRETGHTGQGFSYLWSTLGANTGGPRATSAFFLESSWHLDLVRRSDGSFTYDGREAYGPGKTDDNTYWGNSSYYGLSPNATYVLTYALPLKKLAITGRNFDEKSFLTRDQVAAAIAAGRFDLTRKGLTPTELIQAFRAWSPIVRTWAAQELATRPEAKSLTPQLISLAKSENLPDIQGAVETLGLLKSPEALNIIVKRLSQPDRWVRFKAAQAIRNMGPAAEPARDDLLQALVKTAEPSWPVSWNDPIQLAHGQLAAAVFRGKLQESLKDTDPKLLYPAIRAVSKNPDGMARGQLRNFFQNQLTEEDVISLGPEILAAITTVSPADTMFRNDIRMGAFKALTKYQFYEGIEAGILFAKTQGGHGSQIRTGELMKDITPYGTLAQPYLPKLEELITMFNQQVAERAFPGGELNQLRVNAVKDAIQNIKTAQTAPPKKTLR